MDSCGWTRTGNEEGNEGMIGADAVISWQQCYTWCAPYSHPHPHHHHPHHPRQYQGSQYQQLQDSASAVNATTHYPSAQQQQQHHQQLQAAQPPPLDQQQHLHPITGQVGLRRAIPYDGPGIQSPHDDAPCARVSISALSITFRGNE